MALPTVTLGVALAVVVTGGCGGGTKDSYQPRIVGEDPTGPGLSPTGDRATTNAATIKVDDAVIGSDKSDARTDPWFKMHKCTRQCVQSWTARSGKGAHEAITRDCEYRCKRQWFTCLAAINHALELMRTDPRRRDVLTREGDGQLRAKGLQQCQRRRWLVDTLGCMLKASDMRAFDDCEDDDRKRRRSRR